MVFGGGILAGTKGGCSDGGIEDFETDFPRDRPVGCGDGCGWGAGAGDGGMLGDTRPDSDFPCVLTDSLFASLFLHSFLIVLTLINDDDDLLLACTLAALTISSDSIEKRLDGVRDSGRESPRVELGTVKDEVLSVKLAT